MESWYGMWLVSGEVVEAGVPQPHFIVSFFSDSAHSRR